MRKPRIFANPLVIDTLFNTAVRGLSRQSKRQERFRQKT